MDASTYHHGNLRSALLEHAAAEIEDTGVEKLSLRQVAKRAGVSHAAFAHHFGSAQGLLTALAAEGFTMFGKALSDARNHDYTQGADLLETSGLAYIQFALDHPQLFSLMFSSKLPDFSDPTLDEASMKVFQAFIADVHGSNVLEGDGPGGVDSVAMANWAKVHGLATLLLTGRMRSVLSLDATQRTGAIRQILVNGGS